MLAHNITTALQISVAATGIALLCFGAIKGQFTGVSKIKSALQTLFVGGLAAGAALPFVIVGLFGRLLPLPVVPAVHPDELAICQKLERGRAAASGALSP